MSTDNKLDVLPDVRVLPWDWHNIGAVFGRHKQHSTSLSGRCNVVVRRGFDELEGEDYGQVVEGLGDLGINLRSKQYSFTLSASNLSYKAGNDAPLKAQSLVGTPLPSLKFTFASEFKEDSFASVSYDFAQQRPELALGWFGATSTEKSSVVVHLDPADRSANVRAAVSFPGPEWRVPLYDELTGIIHYPQDNGGRHQLWVQQHMRPQQLLGRTRVGASLDIGRLANWAADCIDNNLQYYLPGIVWYIPLSQQVYRVLVPKADAEQVRHHIEGLALEVQHDFRQKRPAVGLSKRLGSSKVSATYDLNSSTAAVALSAGGFKAGLQLSRTQDGSWKRNPAVTLSIEPLAFL